MSKKKETTTSFLDREYNLGNVVKWLWFLLITGILFAAAVFVMISFTKLPDTEELENPDLSASTIIYSEDLREIGRVYSKNRDILQFDELNPALVKALIATEDERFYGHSGIDARGTLRAFANLSRKGGGSTITQQLAKQFFTGGSKNFIKRIWEKLQEWVIAAQFEKRYTKEEIIAMYFNKYEFLYQSFGVGAAAKNYFGKNQKDLSIEEAAVLVGMFKSPRLFNPKINPERALTRRNVVLKQMVRSKFIKEETYKKLSARPIDMSNFKKPLASDGAAPYFKSTLKIYLRNLLEQDKYRKPDGTVYNIYKDGLKIYTTINYDMQKHAEAAMRNHMQTIQDKYFNKVWKKMDPWTYTTKDEDKKKSIEYRKKVINNNIKTTERYKSLRNKYYNKITNALIKKYPKARFLDKDIIRMLKEEAKPGHLKQLIRDNQISSERAKTYRDILKDELWKTLKSNRKKLQAKTEEVFNKPVKMRVFAYTESGYKMVTMTPIDSIKYHMEHLQLASVALDPKTGQIRTWVGGIGNEYFKIDHVLKDNQVGSTFKPFLYAAAISQGMLPCSSISNIRHEIPAGEMGLMKTWSPDNADSKFDGKDITLMEGLKQSRNSISVGLLKELGSVELVKNMAAEMGISAKKIPLQPSIILGTPEIHVLELTSAYGVFANNGIYNKPSFITKIENAEGKVIYSNFPEQKRVLNEKYNYAMVKLLENNLSNHNYRLQSQYGGKTGTTNDYRDGWFMGVTSDLVVGTWVGGENTWIRFLSITDGSGGAMARPFYWDFMKRLENDKLVDVSKEFFQPEGELVVLDCDRYDKEKLPSKVELDKIKKNKEFNDDFDDEEFQR